jgi:hypothetical protein
MQVAQPGVGFTNKVTGEECKITSGDVGLVSTCNIATPEITGLKAEIKDLKAKVVQSAKIVELEAKIAALVAKSDTSAKMAELEAQLDAKFKLIEDQVISGGGGGGGADINKLKEVVCESHRDRADNSHHSQFGYIEYGSEGYCKSKCDAEHFYHKGSCLHEKNFCSEEAPAFAEFDAKGSISKSVDYTHETNRTHGCQYSCQKGYVWNGMSADSTAGR